MAVLTPDDYKVLRRAIYTPGRGKEELRGLSGGVPNSTKLLDAFQDLEDDAGVRFAAQKLLVDTALGVVTSNTAAQKILAAYYAWKANQLLG